MRAQEPVGKPDLVGLAEITERLGVAPSTVSRWYRRSTFPEPDLRVGRHDLWLWGTVLVWSKRRNRIGLKPPSAVLPDIVDVSGVADRLMIDRRTVEVWVQTGAFPRPDYRWAGDGAWLWKTVELWYRTSRSQVPRIAASRRPSGPRLTTGGPAAAAPEAISSPASTGVTLAGRPGPADNTAVAAVRRPDPVGDLDRIHRYFAEMARSLATSQPDT